MVDLAKVMGLDVPAGGIWTLLETLSPSGVASIDSSVLAAHDLWKVLIFLTPDLVVAAEKAIDLAFNDDSGNNYGTRYVDADAVASVTGQSEIKIGSVRGDTPSSHSFVGDLLITGKSARGNVSDYITVTGVFSCGDNVGYAYNRILNGYWKCGVANITKMNFAFGSNMTGKIVIYYKDF